MAIEQFLFDRLKDLPGDIVCLGYPDMLLTEELDIPEVSDADDIRSWHKWTGKVYDADEAFRLIGKTAVYLDVHASRGKERIVDLNRMVPPDLMDTADIVLDIGTIEHCFNIGHAFMNCVTMCKVGGTVIHTNPMNACNHGFWNISPTAYVDFYTHHGFSIIRMQSFSGSKRERAFEPVPLTGRFHANQNSWLAVEVRKEPSEVPETCWPTQSKYLAFPDLKHV